MRKNINKANRGRDGKEGGGGGMARPGNVCNNKNCGAFAAAVMRPLFKWSSRVSRQSNGAYE